MPNAGEWVECRVKNLLVVGYIRKELLNNYFIKVVNIKIKKENYFIANFDGENTIAVPKNKVRFIKSSLEIDDVLDLMNFAKTMNDYKWYYELKESLLERRKHYEV